MRLFMFDLLIINILLLSSLRIDIVESYVFRYFSFDVEQNAQFFRSH